MHGLNVSDCSGIEAGRPPDRRQSLHPRWIGAGVRAHPNGLHVVVMGMSGLRQRRAEALRHTHHQPVSTDHPRHRVRRTEAVLDRQNHRSVGNEPPCGGRGIFRLRRLGGNDHQVHRLRGCRGEGFQADSAVTAGTGYTQPVRAHGGHVRLVAVDGQHRVTGVRQQSCIDGSHGAAAHDGNVHHDSPSFCR